MAEFDPTKNERLDNEREKSACFAGDAMLEMAGLKDRIYFEEKGNGGQWWFQDVRGEWCGFSQPMAAAYLKQNGISPLCPKNEKLSDLDRIMLHIATNHRVQYAGPIAGKPMGVQWNNGVRVLVTRAARIPEMTPGEFPTIYELLQRQYGAGPSRLDDPDSTAPLESLPSNTGPIQLPYLLGWLKQGLECLIYHRDDHRGLCMVFAGEHESGKSLLKDLISIMFGGRECKPYRFMIGQENFCGEFIGSELWVSDDEQSQTDHKSRSEYGANIKKVVADKLYRIRGMQRDGVVLDMFRRYLICVNREPERLMVLPQLDDDIADKISVLLCHKHPLPGNPVTGDEKAAFWKSLVDELPHFMFWLVNEFQIERDMIGRFGVKHFHHPTLCSDLFQMSRERQIWEQINRVLKFDGIVWQWHGGTTELLAAMTSDSSPLTKRELNDLPAPQWLGKSLRKIALEYPDRCTQKKIDGIAKWFIVADGRNVIDAVNLVRAGRGQVGLASGRVDQSEDEL